MSFNEKEFWDKTLKFLRNPDYIYPSKKQSGFEPIENPPNFPEPCHDVRHNPPSHMVIPYGMQYRHVCPGCGHEFVVQSQAVY